MYQLVYELKAELNVNIFYDSQAMAISTSLACQLYCLCGSSSKVCLIQTAQHDVVAFLAYGWMFAGIIYIHTPFGKVQKNYVMNAYTMHCTGT